MQFRIDQFGSLCFLVVLKLPKLNLETLATALLAEGHVVTVEKVGLASGELVTKYVVHLDHMSDSDCMENCGRKMSLKDYLQSEEFDLSSLGNKHASVFVSSVHQKLNAFVMHIIKAPNCELFSANYQLIIKYHVCGDASLVGLIWPVQLDECNLELGGKNELSDESALTTFIDRAISASSDVHNLRSTFNLSMMEGEDLAKKVAEHQVHLCSSTDCTSCLSPELPSLVTLLKICPDSIKNLDMARKMQKAFYLKLTSLSEEQKMGLSTCDWLESIWDQDDVLGDITDDLKHLIIWMDDERFEFLVDKRLSLLLGEYDPFTAIYHYVISSGAAQDQYEIVLRRPQILDCFTTPFNNLYLKAANSPVLVKPVRGCKAWERMMSLKEDCVVTEDGMESSVIWTHRRISLPEAISMFDSRKKRVATSASVEFVNARKKRKVIFKKLKEAKEGSFKSEDNNDHFEVLNSNIAKHFNRLNGKFLVLAETATWYDTINSEESEKLTKLYSETGCEVPQSTIESVCSSEEELLFLPEYLLLSNGHVMKKRSSPKVLVYPRFAKFSYDDSYSKLLLFYPLKSEEELVTGDLRELISQTNDDNVNLVEEIER